MDEPNVTTCRDFARPAWLPKRTVRLALWGCCGVGAIVAAAWLVGVWPFGPWVRRLEVSEPRRVLSGLITSWLVVSRRNGDGLLVNTCGSLAFVGSSGEVERLAIPVAACTKVVGYCWESETIFVLDDDRKLLSASVAGNRWQVIDTGMSLFSGLLPIPSLGVVLVWKPEPTLMAHPGRSREGGGGPPLLDEILAHVTIGRHGERVFMKETAPARPRFRRTTPHAVARTGEVGYLLTATNEVVLYRGLAEQARLNFPRPSMLASELGGSLSISPSGELVAVFLAETRRLYVLDAGLSRAWLLCHNGVPVTGELRPYFLAEGRILLRGGDGIYLIDLPSLPTQANPPR